MVSPRQAGFASRVERLVQDDGLSYMQAITHTAEDMGLDIETVPRYIDDGLKERIAKCCAKNKTIKNHSDYIVPPKLCE